MAASLGLFWWPRSPTLGNKRNANPDAVLLKHGNLKHSSRRTTLSVTLIELLRVSPHPCLLFLCFDLFSLDLRITQLPWCFSDEALLLCMEPQSDKPSEDEHHERHDKNNDNSRGGVTLVHLRYVSLTAHLCCF